MLNNYGIKRMLPRLIIAAILVNISYWICALAVDVSNLLGESIYNIMGTDMMRTVTGVDDNLTSFWSDLAVLLLSGGAIVTGTVATAGIAVIGGATYGLWGSLALLGIGAISVLLIFLAIVFMLIARQAIIIMLVVISPLAFVAFLLPNTEEWFTRWRKVFFAMLLLYPSISLLFAGGELASAVIRATTTDPRIYTASLIVLAIPALGTFGLMRASSGLLAKVAGAVNNPNRGPLDTLKKKGRSVAARQKGFRIGARTTRAAETGEAFRKGNRGSRYIYGKAGSKRRKARAWIAGIGTTNTYDAEEKDKNAKIAADSAHRNYVAERASKDDAYATAIAGGDEKLGGLVKSYAQQAVREEDKKDIAAARSDLVDKHPEYVEPGEKTFVERIQDGAQGGVPAAELAALAAEIAVRGSGQQYHQALLASMDIQDQRARQMVQSELLSNMREDHFGISDQMRGLMATGGLTRETARKANENVRVNGVSQTHVSGNGMAFQDEYTESLDKRLIEKLSAEKAVSLKPHDMTEIENKLLARGADGRAQMSDHALQSMLNTIAEARSNPNTRIQIQGQTAALFAQVEALAAERNMQVQVQVPTPQNQSAQPRLGRSQSTGRRP